LGLAPLAGCAGEALLKDALLRLTVFAAAGIMLL